MFIRLRLFTFFVTGASALAATSYIITPIPSPGPSYVAVEPRGLNDAGEVVGYVSPGGSATAFFFTGGKLTTFAPDHYSSAANAVNKSGQIAGFGGQFPAAFIFNPGGSYKQLGTLGGASSEA